MADRINPTQIQINPVDNGFTIQAVAVDGKGRNFRRVATDVNDVKKHVKEIIDLFHEPIVVEQPTPDKPEAPPTAKQTVNQGGNAGPKDTSGTKTFPPSS